MMISSIPKWVSNVFGHALRPNAKVVDTVYLSPQIKRIRFQGVISNWSFQIGYANVIRVSETEFRNYTVAYYDKQNNLFDILFHIHGDGVGSRLIHSLKINDELFVSPPRGKKLYDPSIKYQFFFGDETSLGVASALLPLLKGNNHQFQFYFELDEVNKNIPELLEFQNCVVYPKNESFRNEQWIRNLPVFKTDEWNAANFVLVGNARSVQMFRKVLRERIQGNTYSQGYWLEDKKGL
ncbi:siderophore-interacting protein [Chryseosolibacter indicus]|uniref:Siderophore-interacting protein n=1 Tax=Chryseosolibacter indicus TaxID=2782351 RepID=A0ABS5VUD5_9BACT|nr:siderophore-interacting protein [Chryseosolibacter indicus]MBT1705033.1 siderophore-interacting protein [Chryseosolibacter indicus]